MKVRDAITDKQTRFKTYCNCGPGDNPAQSYASGHIGGKGNFPCRKCHAGGTQKAKETDEGFHKMFVVRTCPSYSPCQIRYFQGFQAGEPRSSEATLAEVESQIKSACLGIAQTVKDMQTDTGTKDSYTQYWIDILIDRARNIQKAYPRRLATNIQEELVLWADTHKTAIYNSFLTLPGKCIDLNTTATYINSLCVVGFDASQDTPVEILHTILLGIVKYSWHGSHTSWSAAQKKTYTIRLQSTNTDGLSIHAIRSAYTMQYANSLIGRQLKTLAQVNVFHVHDLITSSQFLLTKAIGELSALLWFAEIRNLEEYLVSSISGRPIQLERQH